MTTELLKDIRREISQLRKAQQKYRQQMLWMRDVQEITGRSRSKIEQWRDEGKINMVKIDGEWCIHRDTLTENIRNLIEDGEMPGLG